MLESEAGFTETDRQTDNEKCTRVFHIVSFTKFTLHLVKKKGKVASKVP